jgi:peptidoglycan hydrolase-like protein with peptidoglycan-binding domain
MESLAYLHLCLNHESPTEKTPKIALELWKDRAAKTRLTFLALTIALGILGGASEALAQSQGESGEDVLRIQFRLQALGYTYVQPTGVYDLNTEQAIMDFQRRKGLDVDGVVGRQTRPVLFGTFDPIVEPSPSFSNISSFSPTSTLPAFPPEGVSYRPPPPPLPASSSPVNLFAANRIGGSRVLRRGDRGEDVKTLQRRLRDLGYYFGDLDGIYGFDTQDAVTRFQIDRGLFPDGIAGSETLAALGLSELIESGDRRYVVVVPGDNNTLTEVRRYVSNPSLQGSRRGNFVNAGQFDNRNDAESLSFYLRARGLDARVAYNP